MLKRIFDVVFAFWLLLLLSPVLFCIYILVVLKMGHPVFFCQSRPGKCEKIFKLLKFRTMTDGLNKQGDLLSDDLRMTVLGSGLRSTSLDELPSLWNVLKGDMSLVGPRPLLVEYLPLYNEEQARRHEVKPGITGWAQVNGRNTISWEDKFKLDVWYVDNQSFWLDMKILLLTVKKVFLRDGISAGGHVTMEPFKGSKT